MPVGAIDWFTPGMYQPATTNPRGEPAQWYVGEPQHLVTGHSE
jgi:hypothetical protein